MSVGIEGVMALSWMAAFRRAWRLLWLVNLGAGAARRGGGEAKMLLVGPMSVAERRSANSCPAAIEQWPSIQALKMRTSVDNTAHRDGHLPCLGEIIFWHRLGQRTL